MEHKNLVLPPEIATPADLSRLERELKDISEAMLQLKLKRREDPLVLPKISPSLNKITVSSQINLLEEADRTALTNYLANLKQKAPVMHISFTSEPSTSFLEKLLTWLRREISPDVLITIGLQPNIGVGCTLRTTNHYFDLSLKQAFTTKKDELIKSLIPSATTEANSQGT